MQSTYLQDQLGSAVVTFTEPVVAGSLTAFDLIYTAGFFGVDDSGGLKIVHRFASDLGPPQFTDPAAENYVTAEVVGDAQVRCAYDEKNHLRPWGKTLSLRVGHGFLRAGDQIVVHYGDRRYGSPGLRMQTFCEDAFAFRVLVDAFATCRYVEVPCAPAVAIVPGTPVTWRAVLPTLRRCGERFRFAVKAEDAWGNPSDRVAATVRLQPSRPVRGLPRHVTVQPGQVTAVVDSLQVEEAGDLVIHVLDAAGRRLTTSNPLRIVDAAARVPYWGDLHGQSEETIGTNTARRYLQFGRDRAFLDAIGHQGNDFQITPAFWATLQQLTREFTEPGRFLAFPGYEWSANTGLGGDHNVLFLREGETLHRSSHALVDDHTDVATDCPTIDALVAALAGRDVFLYAHAGGRYADLRLVKKPPSNLAVEVHSAWGTFEWLLQDAFDRGLRVGVVANSDDHKGRPGASYPGAATFGASGGLTCFLCPALTREALFDSLRRRHHYATTGTRLHLAVTATTPHGDSATMGDLVATPAREARLTVDALCPAPIERVDLLNGSDLLETVKPFPPAPGSRRIRVLWEGADRRGRGRETTWDGYAAVEGNRFDEVHPINFWNPLRSLVRETPQRVTWHATTTGGFSGFDALLATPLGGALTIHTPLLHPHLNVSEIGYDDQVFEAGGLARRMRLFRLPEHNPTRHLHLERTIPLRVGVDNPLYVRVTMEDGHRAWSSPIYFIPR